MHRVVVPRKRVRFPSSAPKWQEVSYGRHTVGVKNLRGSTPHSCPNLRRRTMSRDEWEWIADSPSYSSEFTYDEIKELVKKNRKNFVDFKVKLDYGYYEGEEHLAFYGKRSN